MTKLIAKTTTTGSDVVKFYNEPGTTDVYVLHVQEWAEVDSYAVAEYGKYNVAVQHVDVCGFDNFVHDEGSYEAKHRMQPSMGCGHSVHASLRSSDLMLTGHGLGCFDLGLRAIEQRYDGREVAAFGDRKVCMLVIAEAMADYGAGDRIFDDSGNNARILERNARRSF